LISNTDLTAIDSFAEVSNTLSAAVSSNTAAMDAEASTRLAADGSLASDLSAEISNREAAIFYEESVRSAWDATLATELSDEVVNRETAVSTEASLRVAADLSLAADLSTEVVDRTNAVSSEASLRVAGDNSIAANLSTEIVDRSNAVSTEASLRVAGDASVEANLSTEVARAQSAEGSLATTIANVISNSDPAALDSLVEIVNAFESADDDLNGAITSLATGLSTDISSEASARVSADASLASGLSTEISLTENKITELSTATSTTISSEVSDRIADVDAEESRAMSVETLLSNEIDSVWNYYDDVAIPSLESRDNSIAADLSSEVSARVAGDASLEVLVDEYFNDLQSYVDTEVVPSIENNISAEESARIEGDASLAADLSAEESARVAGDTSLAADLSSEIDGLADVDGATISLDSATNTIRLKEAIAAPASGMYTFNSDVEVSGALTVGGVNVMDEISAEISRAEAAEASLATQLSTDVSYLIANTDLTAIDSFAEVSDELDIIVNNFNNIYFQKASYTGAINGTNDAFTLTNTVRANSETVYLNGLLQEAGVDYTCDGNVVTFTSAPQTGDKVVIYGVY